MSVQRRGIETSKGSGEILIPEENIEFFQDFCEFSKKMLSSKDIDPMYSVLKTYYKNMDLPKNIALWRTFIYVATYHIGCAELAWQKWPVPTVVMSRHIDFSFNTGTERRLFRGRKHDFIRHINHFIQITKGDIKLWIARQSPYGEAGWRRVREAFELVPFNGPWASYKWADLLKHVHDYKITANDIGVGGGGKNAGPIPGMVKLTGIEWRVCAKNKRLQKALLKLSIDHGVPFDGLDQLETALCDFNSLTKGKYYVGHDIDMQMEQLSHSTASLWEARAEAIPDNYRGEVCGWFGVRKKRNSVYLNKGIVI